MYLLLCTPHPAHADVDAVKRLLNKGLDRQGTAAGPRAIKAIVLMPAAASVPASFVRHALYRCAVLRQVHPTDMIQLLQLPAAKLVTAADYSELLAPAVASCSATLTCKNCRRLQWQPRFGEACPHCTLVNRIIR
jgi:hypothetical protein